MWGHPRIPCGSSLPVSGMVRFMSLLDLRVVTGPAEVVLPAFKPEAFGAVVSDTPTDDPVGWGRAFEATAPGGWAVVIGGLDVAGAMEDAGFGLVEKSRVGPDSSDRFLILARKAPAPPHHRPPWATAGGWRAIGRALGFVEGTAVVDPWATTGATAAAASLGAEWVGVTAPGRADDVLDAARRHFAPGTLAPRRPRR